MTLIERAPAVVRGSQCPDLVLQITALRDMLPSDIVEDLLRAAASIRTHADEKAMRQLLIEVRSNPVAFIRAGKQQLAASRKDRRRRAALARRATH